MTEPLLSRLSNRLTRPVSDECRSTARLHLLDWLACVAGARDSEAGHLGGEIARSGWERATYAGNALGFADESADGRVNPGCVIWPAAMSMPSASMEQRLDAGVRGYEAMLALAGAFDDHHAKHWHMTATTGGVGAAAAFGSLIGFAAIEHAHAMVNAASVAGGVRHGLDQDALTGQWHIYHAVRTGRDAALHVHYGATGAAGVLEGQNGVFAAMTDIAGELASAGDGWLLGEARCKPMTADGAEGCSATAEQMQSKMRLMATKGGVSNADDAIALALDATDTSALDTMLENWLA